ncbi:MAG: endonuclease [Mailhella sp.]|nr:endonuclease [Mailhella sp.]
MNKALLLAAGLLLLLPCSANADGNRRISDFTDAKHLLHAIWKDHRETLYCGFRYDGRRKVDLPSSFRVDVHRSRAWQVEAEHIVPVEHFGPAFPEWRNGDPMCVNSRGRRYNGRKCTEERNLRFRLMQCDLHNLAPADGAVNAWRGHARFDELGHGGELVFGPVCPMAFDRSRERVEPPARSKGIIARAYLYMDDAYPEFTMSDHQRKLMEAWDRQHPPTAWECERNRRITRMQGNANRFVDRVCR